jgi:hypothetical protein
MFVGTDKWLKYDDDKVSFVNDEEIKKLSGKGGGDWHMAYLWYVHNCSLLCSLYNTHLFAVQLVSQPSIG